MLRLFTDTDCDITPEIAKKYGFNLISMPYSFDAKDTVYPYENGEDVDFKAYYDYLREGNIPNTSAVSCDKYIQIFEPFFKNGDDIFNIHFSRKMTQSFDEMDKAVAILKEKYPERKFYSFDTKAIVGLSYIMVTQVGEMYQKGATIEEMLAWCEENWEHYAIYFFADNLKFFKHSGRVSGMTAFMGNLVGIRPIINISKEGKMDSIGKERGRVNAINRLVSYMEELGDDVKNHPIIINHTDAGDLVDELMDAIKAKFGEDTKMEVVMANPTCGGHCGPNGIGVAFHSTRR